MLKTLAICIFLIGWLGAVWALFGLGAWKALQRTNGNIWRDRDARWRFLVFLAFCGLGVVSAGIGAAFSDR